MSNNEKGLYQKYNITHADGSPADPEAVYFVLRLDKGDTAALLAAHTYAVHTENKYLGLELWEKVKMFQLEFLSTISKSSTRRK